MFQQTKDRLLEAVAKGKLSAELRAEMLFMSNLEFYPGNRRRLKTAAAIVKRKLNDKERKGDAAFLSKVLAALGTT